MTPNLGLSILYMLYSVQHMIKCLENQGNSANLVKILCVKVNKLLSCEKLSLLVFSSSAFLGNVLREKAFKYK